MTLEEYADKMWKSLFGEKSYEEVEREFAERDARNAEAMVADLPYKKSEDGQG